MSPHCDPCTLYRSIDLRTYRDSLPILGHNLVTRTVSFSYARFFSASGSFGFCWHLALRLGHQQLSCCWLQLPLGEFAALVSSSSVFAPLADVPWWNIFSPLWNFSPFVGLVRMPFFHLGAPWFSKDYPSLSWALLLGRRSMRLRIGIPWAAHDTVGTTGFGFCLGILPSSYNLSDDLTRFVLVVLVLDEFWELSYFSSHFHGRQFFRISSIFSVSLDQISSPLSFTELP